MDGDREAALQSFINITGAETAQALGLLEVGSFLLGSRCSAFLMALVPTETWCMLK